MVACRHGAQLSLRVFQLVQGNYGGGCRRPKDKLEAGPEAHLRPILRVSQKGLLSLADGFETVEMNDGNRRLNYCDTNAMEVLVKGSAER